ncbi:gamma-glutamylcyclotransferase [Aliiroseovarius subalbicans]|uniref:gamma-glutamylcyclotransferase n=1 Tax=Aliiroseovarius subalbicans TaxID=2925840 RepID=UPI001F56DBBE|nr:gamma-glutamylcyclotransferase [Aliiroseovarius subalbicans]MCI2398523.1 gamma-glutamylcyclotransferase [Aliiroseovarius subalbicans]
MTDLFFYGTLRHAPLLALVLGADAPAAQQATLPGHEVLWAEGECFPMIRKTTGATAQGVLVQGLDDAALARLNFYEGGFDYALEDVTVRLGGTDVVAQVYFPAPGLWTPGAPWSLEDWVRDWGAMTLHAADEVMSYFGQVPAEEVARRFSMIRTRAASRARAEASAAPTTLRSALGDGDVAVTDARRPYSNFFTLEEHDLSFRRFNGAMSASVNRAGFLGGDAVTVLPYDPVRDRVLVIEQFRVGPHLRGDPHPWVLEPIAGRIDAGESPQDAARREGLEEAGLEMQALEHIADYYPSPGAVSEFLYSYVGLADLPDSAAGLGGVDHEQEDIRSHVISFDRLMELVTSGEAGCGPLVLSALWLGQNRDRLRRRG